MMDEEKYVSQDDLSSLVRLPSEIFGVNWEDGILESDYNNLFDDLAENSDDIKVEETVSSCVQEMFVPASVVANGNSSDFPVLENFVTAAYPLASVGTSDPVASPGTSADFPEVKPVSSLPATNDWIGDHGFDVYFEETKPPPNGAKWTYSKLKDKIYVKRNVPLPIKFQTRHYMPLNTKIRAMAVFNQVKYSHDVVQRCHNHLQQDSAKGIPLANHLVKCESKQAVYEEDPISSRLSVVVQYENPQSGEKYSTYIFKFTCWGSCAGGLNRRPVKIVFTLECGDRVVGRRSIDLRICACPLRDRMSEEMRENGAKATKRKYQKSGDEENGLVSFLNVVGGQPKKKTKHSSTPPNGQYCISVDDYNLYNFLKEMKKFYIIYGALDNVAPHIEQMLHSHTSSSESSAED